MIASIIVDIKMRQVNRPFDYLVKKEMENVINKGMRVKVPFNKRLLLGFVVDLKDKSEYQNLKEIEELIDIVPILNSEMLDIAYKMAKDTNCFIINCLETILPSAMRATYTKYLHMIKPLGEPLDELFKKDTIVYNKNISHLLPQISERVKNNQIEVIYEVDTKETNKTLSYIELIKDEKLKGEKQKKVVDYLKEVKIPVLKKSLMEFTNSSIATIKTLLEKGIIREIKKEEYREIKTIDEYESKSVILNSEQENCLNQIKLGLNSSKTFLLHGITGSGKTEIYLNIIDDVLKQGKDAIVLVPEISLTPQMVSRFKGRFKNEIAVLHSALSKGEKYDEWKKIIRKEAHVALGARSAIFAPLNNIGIIIIDECHEKSYIQDNNPKYSAIEIAKERSIYHNAPLLLGSATPNIEDYEKALEKKYELLEIKKRANNASIPTIKIVDMTLEIKSANKSIFSRELMDLIKDRLEKKEQIILLLNKRGHSSFVMCRDCGNTITCPHCDVTLTYHINDNMLRCHYCGYQQKNVSICPACQSDKIKYVGGGTEKVEEMLNLIFPSAKVLRMDYDTTRKKGSHERILSDFGKHKADVLVGTQMIAKGLDFPNVTLVGILNADMILKLPDFKSSERTFQLISQVIGRAGRHEKNGLAIIQTYNKNHYSIVNASKNDYLAFYNMEMNYRKACNYFPFVNMVQLIISSKEYNEGVKQANIIRNRLRKNLNEKTKVYDPTIATIGKINDMYRISIIIKYKEDNKIEDELNEIINHYQDGRIAINIEKNNFQM